MSPPDSRPLREPGVAGWPSPDSTAAMERSSAPKRQRSALQSSASRAGKTTADESSGRGEGSATLTAEPPLVARPGGHATQASVESAVSTESNGAEKRLKKLIKYVRQIEALKEQAAHRALNDEEQTKIGCLEAYQLEIGTLLPAAGVGSPSSARTPARTPSSAASAAPTRPAAASVAAMANAANTRLSNVPLPPTRVGTRANAVQVRRGARTRVHTRGAAASRCT